MSEKLKKYSQIPEIPFKLYYLFFAFCTFCNLTYAKPVMTFAVDGALALGAAAAAGRLINLKSYLGFKGIYIAGAFTLSYVLSAAVNFSYGYADNLKYLVWTLFHFCLLFASSGSLTESDRKKEAKIIMLAFSFITFALSLASLVQFFSGFGRDTYFTDRAPLIEGFVWGRLWGVYYDPNYGGVFAVMTAVFSVYLFQTCRKAAARVFFAINFVTQLLYVAFADSRTALTALFCSLTVYSVLTAGKKCRERGKGQLAGAAAILLCVLLSASVTLLPPAVKKANNALTSAKTGAAATETTVRADGTEVIKQTDASVGRENDIKDDISNGRLSLWSDAVKIFANKPLTGISYFNIAGWCKENMPSLFVSEENFSNFHNLFFNVLASQGLPGVITMLALAVFIVVKALRGFAASSGENAVFRALLIAGMTVSFVSSMFLTDIIYCNSPTSVVFWLFSGYCLMKPETETQPA